MRTFKQSLDEAPMPADVDKEKFKQSKLSFAGLIKTFTEHFGKPIGTGSSRSVFSVSVSASEFNDNMKSDLGIDTNFSGNIDTVFKVAKNPKGVIQNMVEVNVYRDAKVLNYDRFFCPMIDNSKRILNLKDIEIEDMEVNEGYMFIQMAKCEKMPEKEMINIFAKVFGLNKIEYPVSHVKNGYKFTNYKLSFDINRFGICMHNSIKEKRLNPIDFKYLDDKNMVSLQQKENVQALFNACAELEISDLSTFRNWGIYKGNPVLIDYGYNTNSTEKIYWEKHSFVLSVWLDKNTGNVVHKTYKK